MGEPDLERRSDLGECSPFFPLAAGEAERLLASALGERERECLRESTDLQQTTLISNKESANVCFDEA